MREPYSTEIEVEIVSIFLLGGGGRNIMTTLKYLTGKELSHLGQNVVGRSQKS